MRYARMWSEDRNAVPHAPVVALAQGRNFPIPYPEVSDSLPRLWTAFSRCVREYYASGEFP